MTPVNLIPIFEKAYLRCKNGLSHAGPFLLDSSLNQVKCKACDALLNPMWVLTEMAKIESQYRMRIESLKAQAGKAESKTKVKCQHCHKMTQISRAKRL